jgi:anti-sigma factor RsiW
MTDFPTLTPSPSPSCQIFEDRLPDYLDGSCTESERATLDAHRAACTHCDAVTRDLEEIVQQAASLPDRSPSRDLWSGIESRLESDITELAPRWNASSPSATSTPLARRTISVRTFAIAATVLVAVTSGVTWQLARVQPVRGRAPVELASASSASVSALAQAPSVPAANAITRSDSVRIDSGVDVAVPARLVASSPADVDDIYEREIAGLRRVVTERFTELDSTTVSDLRRNLDIIDAAIADSRRALQRDPRSRLLSTQLDRALETKLALMRRVALL